MPTPHAPITPGPTAAAPLAEALKQTTQVAEEIGDAAEELAVVHAVLDTKLPEGARDADVSLAVERANELEKRLLESADKLETANEILEQAVAAQGVGTR